MNPQNIEGDIRNLEVLGLETHGTHIAVECRKGVAARFAANNMDWGQVVCNGGPPCFHLCEDQHFCGRAKSWDGHGEPGFHNFVSLADLIVAARSDVPALVKALRRALGHCEAFHKHHADTERTVADITRLLSEPAGSVPSGKRTLAEQCKDELLGDKL